MISALSGSTSAQLLSLFARPQPQSLNATQAAQQPSPPVGPPPGPPPTAGNGASPQSLFEAMSAADDPSSSNSTSRSDLLSNLRNTLDTDGDGKLSVDELKSAVATLQGDTSGAGTATNAATTTTSASTSGAKSLYESLFNAMASMTGGRDSSSQMKGLSQKFLSALTA